MKSKFNFRTWLAYAHDIVTVGVTWCAAYWLRFNLSISPEYTGEMLQTLPWVMLLYGLVFFQFGLYRGIWRYASLPDLKRIVIAVFFGTSVLALTIYMVRFHVAVPRSVLLMQPIFLIVLMGGSRLAYRSWKEQRLYGINKRRGKPVLVLGAGDAALLLVKEMERSHEWRVAGLLDDDILKKGRMLHGVRVLGRLADVRYWAEEYKVKHAIMAMPSAPHEARRRAIDLCADAELKVLTVPSYKDIMSGRVTVSQVRKVELEDLLGRDPVLLDNAGLHDCLSNKVIMVTGAGGSIGSELCRQIAAFKPSLLVLFEVNEFAMYRIEQEFSLVFPELSVACVMGDVKNRARVERTMRMYSPSVIFHAAAYKHVPMMEENNAWEAVQNNVWGTYVVASAAMSAGVKKFVLISTDKAVNPTNVMGATKRLAEMVCQSLQRGSATQFEMVRFGNVLGSAGSVIPKFQEQIASGGPVTVTHPDIIRYFMSIPEAAQLVLQAGCMGQGGDVFVMDMGEPVKITDLAREMIRLAGYTEEEIKIVYTGLRPGEKLFEELLADNETTRPSDHPKLRIAKANHMEHFDINEITHWLQQHRYLDDDEVRRDLKRWVPEYSTMIKPRLVAV
ncbi:MAG TPA: nucleoside-diphosphate sugar epimerase/dehydratase [Burkholderiales bacterium]|nr:nucleoside-diphosphate sugar epimerase/dehydratase [Burkholderiales bacterium]